jgi:hypothetical protein
MFFRSHPLALKYILCTVIKEKIIYELPSHLITVVMHTGKLHIPWGGLAYNLPRNNYTLLYFAI